MSECNENGYPNGREGRCKYVFFGHHFRDPAPNQCNGAPDPPKVIDLLSKSEQKVTWKLTHVSSPCSLRNICGELGDPKMAPSFAHYVLFFSLQAHGENHPHGLSAHS